MADGLRVTSFWRTVFDCMATMEPRDALAIADSALRMSSSRPRHLLRHLRFARKATKGIKRAVEIARFADPLSESGGESIARATMLRLGFELPLLQVWMDDPMRPGHRFRVDFVWICPDGTLLFAEHDGMEKTKNQKMRGPQTPEAVRFRERLRESRLTIYGARVVRFSHEDVKDREGFRRLLDAFGAPRRVGRMGLPPAMPVYNELFTVGGWTAIVSKYEADDLRDAGLVG